jgi:pimeloyl-ACP methyl ester carboxylesterase
VTLVEANGLTLHIQVLTPDAVPRPPTVVLLHGLASDTMASWYFTLAYPLVEMGFRVLLLDLRGHGRSERPAHGYALDDFVDDLGALLASHGGPGPHLLFGNSFGGTIAYAYAARHPDRVAGIVAVESSPPTAAWFARLRRRLGELAAAVAEPRALAAVGARRGAQGERRAREAGRLLADTTLRAELSFARLPDPARIAEIECPVLCLYGDRSLVAELAGETRELLPQAEIRVFAGQKHSLLIDCPDEVRAAITTWLREQIHLGG